MPLLHCRSRPSDKNQAQGLGVAHFNFHWWSTAFHKDDHDNDDGDGDGDGDDDNDGDDDDDDVNVESSNVAFLQIFT